MSDNSTINLYLFNKSTEKLSESFGKIDHDVKNSMSYRITELQEKILSVDVETSFINISLYQLVIEIDNKKYYTDFIKNDDIFNFIQNEVDKKILLHNILKIDNL